MSSLWVYEILKSEHSIMKKSFLVTGATGFIGANLVRRLVSRGDKVSIIVRDKDLNWRINDIADKVAVYICDILDLSLVKIIKKISATHIFHFASYGSLPIENDFKMMIDVNVKGTMNLLNAVEKTSFSLFLNAGTSSEYGIKDKSMKETNIAEPVNDYGVSKLAQTLFCSQFAKRRSLPVVTFRLSSPYGYHEEYSRLVPSVVLKAISNNPIEASSQKNVRDFIFIEDVIDAFIKACDVSFASGDTINISYGNQHSVGDVVSSVIKYARSKSSIEWGAVEKQHRQIEPKKWIVSNTKARKILRWKPRYSLDDGIIKTVDWFVKNKLLYEKSIV